MASQDTTPSPAVKLTGPTLVNSDDVAPLLQLQQDVAAAVAQKVIQASAADQLSEVLNIIEAGITGPITAAQQRKIDAAISSSDIPPSITKSLKAVVYSDFIVTPKMVNGVEQSPDAQLIMKDGDDKSPDAIPVNTSDISSVPTVQKRFNGPKDVGLATAILNHTIAYLKQLKSGVVASVESLNPLRIQPTIVTGARAVLRINGLPVGYANNISYSYDTEWVEVSGVDSEFPDELVPGMVRVTGTISVFRKPNNSASQLFWQSDMLRMRIWPYSVIEVRDKRTDNLIAKFPRVAFTRRAETVAAGQITTTLLSFVSIGFRDELDPQPPTTQGESSGLINQGKKVASAAKNAVNKLLSFNS